jgi:hypothetical protein
MTGLRTIAACQDTAARSNATAFNRTTLEAFIILGNQRGELVRQDTPAASLEALAMHFAIAGNAGKHVMIRETDTITGKSLHHFFVIRRGSWQGHFEPGESGGMRKAFPHRAERLFTIADPIAEPWEWTPGADVVGVDPGIIEQRSAQA